MMFPTKVGFFIYFLSCKNNFIESTNFWYHINMIKEMVFCVKGICNIVFTCMCSQCEKSIVFWEIGMI
jgi:hypothetical protein